MKNKLGWIILFCFFFFGKNVNAQNETSEYSDKQYLRYGFGLSSIGRSTDQLFFNYELGFIHRFNKHVSYSAILNYGFGFELEQVGALQSNLSTVFLFSPFKNTEAVIVEMGFGPSILTSYFVHDWDGNLNGAFPGGCFVFKFAFYRERNGYHQAFNIMVGQYTSNNSIIGFTLFKEISIQKIKLERQKRKIEF